MIHPTWSRLDRNKWILLSFSTWWRGVMSLLRHHFCFNYCVGSVLLLNAENCQHIINAQPCLALCCSYLPIFNVEKNPTNLTLSAHTLMVNQAGKCNTLILAVDSERTGFKI